ncbi:T-box transcription factor TBX21 [Lampris incognitus]|uniref:T-box transcription factor TBX21 n=1 Tax=Lampris incognitus TaxID=2546036 RepID=UPI0024B4EE4B|nr:T-box transcription factor TBX21 [Lampris incognitus]
MGGIDGNLYLSMLNGSDAQTFGKDNEINSHLHRGGKDLSDFKMGIQDARFFYPDSVQSGQDALALPYHAEQTAGGLGAQPGRFYSPTLGTAGCPFGGVRSPARSGTGQGYIPLPGEAKEVYPASPESYPAAFQHGYPRTPLYPLPGLQVCGKTQALLNNYPLWAKFHKFQTEMIITKQGRRMFPFLSFNISVLDPSAHYKVYVDVILADQHHWRYQGGKWVQCGKAEGNMPGNRTYMHPDSPNTGAHWMRQEVSFGKLKLTNNKGSNNNVAQMIVLQSLHKYQPRLHIVEVKEDGSEEPFLSAKAQTFIFPETQFIAVTAYQNADITQLKIDHNPFAKGFRDNYDTLYAPPDTDRLTPSPTESQQLLPGTCYPQSYLSEQYMSPLPQSRLYSREHISMSQQPKEPSSSPGPHGRWYLPPQQSMAPSRLDFTSSYEGDFSSNGFYKPFPLQTSAHHHHHHPLGYYPDHPFASSGVSVSGASSVGWSTSRPSPPYLSHPSKPSPSLGWFRPMSSSSSSSSSSSTSPGHPRLQPASLLEPLRPALLQDKPKEAGVVVMGEDPWLEPPSVKSVDSTDSGLFEGGVGESKKRRVSPYTSSTENSPPARGGEVCEKDSSSDAGYYGFYTQ